ncbi:MAG: phytanoyl-CoA dioxygenase family protein [Planctomycetales bacterium]|nr:phytanoyl-CoA dioxygenase family protein [Planctomycetales bacterium]
MTTGTLASDAAAELHSQGFLRVSQLAPPGVVAKLISSIAADESLQHSASRSGAHYASRNLLHNGEVQSFSRSPRVLALLGGLMGAEPFAVRAILFDKAPGANWRVGWHQDLMIPVQQRIETPGFTAWSVKAGVHHVKPPAEVLQRMLTIRLALDDCGEENGPLEVQPGSHREGVLSSSDIRGCLSRVEPHACTTRRGDAVLMRPLLLHGSRKATAPSHRRVLHVEYACEGLPGGLEWESS